MNHVWSLQAYALLGVHRIYMRLSTMQSVHMEEVTEQPKFSSVCKYLSYRWCGFQLLPSFCTLCPVGSPEDSEWYITPVQIAMSIHPLQGCSYMPRNHKKKKKLFCHIYRKLKPNNQVSLFLKPEKSKIQRATRPKYQLSTAQSTPPRSENVLLCSTRFLHPKEQLGQCLSFRPGFFTSTTVSMIISIL